MPGDEDASQSVGHASINQLEAQSHSRASQDQRPPRLETHGWELQQGCSFQQGMYVEYNNEFQFLSQLFFVIMLI